MAKKNDKSRAPNGSGTIRERKDGSWEARYTAPDGRQRSVYAKTRSEVKEKLKRAQAELTLGIWEDPNTVTVSEWLTTWKNDFIGHTTGQTKEAYLRLCEKRFDPCLGKIKLRNVTSAHVRHMLNDMKKAGLSAATITQARAVFGTIMNAAVDTGLIKENPVKKVKVPRKDTKPFTIIDRDKIGEFITAAQNTQYPNELIFLLMTGLRVGEMRGLMWADINFGTGVMSVERQLHAPSSDVREFRPPKYNEKRTIQLPPEAIAVLKQQRSRQAEQRLQAGTDWIEDQYSKGLVFRQTNGKSHYEYEIYRAVQEAGRAIGITDIHPHDLRHSYAVAALRSGADIKAIQNNLGHRSAKMTLDVYAGYTSDMGKTSAERFSAYWQNAIKTTPLG